MKIVIVAHYFLPHKGGLEFVVYNQAKELVRRGHEVTILTSKTGDEPNEENFEGIKVRRVNVWNWFERKWGVPYPVYKIGILKIFNNSIKKSDIVYIHDLFYMPCYFATFFANLYKKPIVLMEHINNVNHSKKIVNLIQGIVMESCGKYVLNSAKKIIVCNKKVGEWLKKRFNRKNDLIFIKNAVNTNLFKPTNKKQKLELRKKNNLPLKKSIILFVGRLYEVKGFDKLFDARSEDYFILFVGHGNPTREMLKDRNVKFVDAVSQKKLVEYYQLSDMFCLPSRNEGFPLSILEALSCGIPVISSNLKGYDKYLNKKDAILIDTSKTNNIKNAILKIIKNKKRYEDLQKYYRNKAIKEFSWELNVDNLEKIFKQSIKINYNETTKTKNKRIK